MKADSNPKGETKFAGSEFERREAAARRAKGGMPGVILLYRDVRMPAAIGVLPVAALARPCASRSAATHKEVGR